MGHIATDDDVIAYGDVIFARCAIWQDDADGAGLFCHIGISYAGLARNALPVGRVDELELNEPESDQLALNNRWLRCLLQRERHGKGSGVI